MTDPTDDEIAALRSEFGITSNGRGIKEFTQVRDFARAVLAKWGTPATVGVEPFGIWHEGETEDESDFFLFKDSGDVSCPSCVKLYTAEQVLAMGREPLTDEQIRAMCKEPWIFDTAKQWVRLIEAAHGIKQGGQHD